MSEVAWIAAALLFSLLGGLLAAWLAIVLFLIPPGSTAGVALLLAATAPAITIALAAAAMPSLQPSVAALATLDAVLALLAAAGAADLIRSGLTGGRLEQALAVATAIGFALLALLDVRTVWTCCFPASLPAALALAARGAAALLVWCLLTTFGGGASVGTAIATVWAPLGVLAYGLLITRGLTIERRRGLA